MGNGLVILLLCFGPRKWANNPSLGNGFFWKFWQWSQVFLWQAVLFLCKAWLKTWFPDCGQHWEASSLTAPQTSFSGKSIAQKSPSSFTPYMVSTHFLVFCLSAPLPSLSPSFGLPRNGSVSCDLYQDTPLVSAFYTFRSLAPAPDCL